MYLNIFADFSHSGIYVTDAITLYMKVIERIDQMQRARGGDALCHARSIGFVPTMGALHRGHQALIARALAHHDFAVCSLFVNPIQFDNPEDFRHYPTRLSDDLAWLEKHFGSCDSLIVFMPSVAEMYPTGQAQVSIHLGDTAEGLEGKCRPGHFSGVAVVLMKLFNIVRPTHAYFGQKDLQQLAVVKRMVRALDIPMEIREVETFREASGLAISSRNLRLSASQKKQAAGLHQVLIKIKKRCEEGVAPAEALAEGKQDITEKHGMRLAYLAVVDAETMSEVNTLEHLGRLALCVAAYVGQVRLIDNIYI